MKMTMNKKYLLFAAAALTLAACSNDDENLNGGPVELRLSSSLEVQTRAGTYKVRNLMPMKTLMCSSMKTLRPVKRRQANMTNHCYIPLWMPMATCLQTTSNISPAAEKA